MIALIILCCMLFVAILIGAFVLFEEGDRGSNRSKPSKPKSPTPNKPSPAPTKPTTESPPPTKPTTSTPGSPPKPTTSLPDSSAGYNPIVLTQDNVQELVDLLNAGKAVGSSRSLYEGYYLNTMTNSRFDNNYFEDITVKAREAYGKVCNEGQNCDRTVAQGTPVWTGPVIDSDIPFMKSLSDRVEECIQKPSRRCFSDNMAYVVDLDNYGPPRMQSVLAKMIAFVVDMRNEARSFQPRNDQERLLRDTFVNQNAFFCIHLYSTFKKQQQAVCPIQSYACAGGMNGLFVPVFIDPNNKGQSDYYTFLHELGHVLERKSMMSDGTSPPCIEDHPSAWHKCCIFLNHMALLVLRRRGIVPANHVDMTPFLSNVQQINRYHSCFFNKGLPNFTNPTVAWS